MVGHMKFLAVFFFNVSQHLTQIVCDQQYRKDRGKDKGCGKIKQNRGDQAGRGGIKEETIVDAVFIVETTSVVSIVITLV